MSVAWLGFRFEDELVATGWWRSKGRVLAVLAVQVYIPNLTEIARMHVLPIGQYSAYADYTAYTATNCCSGCLLVFQMSECLHCLHCN
jgi:hypothetical protein